MLNQEIVIGAGVRTPMAEYGGHFAALSANPATMRSG